MISKYQSIKMFQKQKKYWNWKNIMRHKLHKHKQKINLEDRGYNKRKKTHTKQNKKNQKKHTNIQNIKTYTLN